MFLITGCQRSGTTLLAMALEAHPMIEMVEENDKRVHVEGNVTRELDFRAALSFAERRDQVVGFKSPRDSHRLDDLFAIHPSVRVLWIERDIRQTVSSMLALHISGGSWASTFAPREINKYISKTGDRNARSLFKQVSTMSAGPVQSVAYGALCWLVKRQQRILAAQRPGLKLWHIDYDEIVGKPAKVLGGTLAFLDLPWSPEILNHPESIADFARPGGADPHRLIDVQSRDAWKSRLSPGDLEIIDRITHAFEAAEDVDGIDHLSR
jgi:hypothetical protein